MSRPWSAEFIPQFLLLWKTDAMTEKFGSLFAEVVNFR